MSKSNWPVKTLILPTYRDGKLINVAAHSFAHPDFIKKYIYSLRFD